MSDHMTTGQAARILGMSRDAIRWRCERGRIPGAYQIDPGRSPWRIPREWIERVRARAGVVRRRKGDAGS